MRSVSQGADWAKHRAVQKHMSLPPKTLHPKNPKPGKRFKAQYERRMVRM